MPCKRRSHRRANEALELDSEQDLFMEHRNADPLAERARREQANPAVRPESPAKPLDATAEERSAADLLADALNAPSAAESAVMVLLVDDQTIVAEAVRRALVDQPRLD